MYVFTINPARIGHLDVLLPIILQLKKNKPDIYFQLVYFDKDQYETLLKNKFLNEIVKNVGEAVLLKSLGRKGSILRKFLLTVQLIPYIFRMIISKHVIFLQWKSIDNLILKFIALIASFKGKALTYQPMNNHYLEEMRRYFDYWIKENKEDLNLVKREIVLFDKSRDQNYADYLDPELTALLNSVNIDETAAA